MIDPCYYVSVTRIEVIHVNILQKVTGKAALVGMSCFFGTREAINVAKYENWTTEYGLVQIEGWARDGLTIAQIAENMGVSRSTLNAWSKKFSDISDTLKKGREYADRTVESSLFKRAVGYSVMLKKPIKVREIKYNTKGKRVESEKVIYADEEVHIPADVTAQIFWLKNRKPEVWRDKVTGDMSMKVENDGFIEALKGQAAEVFIDSDVEE